MLDVTQAMACIQCGVCVSACLSLEVDPEFIGPAALAKAYRFVGDPRDGAHEERLKDLAEDPHGIYDCTHCFACVEVCPKDVAPMNQIMRLRRRATDDFEIKDDNNGYGHEKAFVKLIEKYGTLHEAQLLPRSFGNGSLVTGQLKPSAVKQLVGEPPTAVRGLKSGKVTPKKALLHPKLPDQDQVRRIFNEIESHGERIELNLYIVGESGGEEAEVVKLAYWPGCVSRGFTPELHGSVAKVAPLLDLELVELDRANCCGAGVIAEHNQELADTLNARTFAHGPAGGGRRGHDEHLLHLPGRAVRVPGAARRQLRVPGRGEHPPEARAALLREVGALVEQELPLDPGRGDRPRRASASASSARSTGLRIAPFYGCYIVRPTRRLGFDEHPERDQYLEQLIEALGAEPVDYAGARKCCGFPVITMNRTTSLRQAGRHLADAIDAGADCLVTPCPLCHLNLDMQQPARRARSSSATSTCRSSTCRRWSASRSASSRRSWGWASTWSPRATCSARSPRSPPRPEPANFRDPGRKTARIPVPRLHPLLDCGRDANRGFGPVRGSRRARSERPHRRGPEP